MLNHIINKLISWLIIIIFLVLAPLLYIVIPKLEIIIVPIIIATFVSKSKVTCFNSMSKH